MDEAPDLVEPIVAYRGWDTNGLTLYSITRTWEWPVGIWAEAQCDQPIFEPQFAQDFATELQFDVQLSPDDAIHSWQSNQPVRIIRGGIEITVKFSMRGPGEALTEQFEKGVVVRFDPKQGMMYLSTLAQLEEEPEAPPPPPPVPPHVQHQCGIYAVSQMSLVPDPESSRVIGAVHLAGKIIPGTTGYRAQKAKIVALLDSWRTRKLGIREISEMYGVPVVKDLPEATSPDQIPYSV